MPEFVKIVALTALLFIAQELLRRSSKWVLWGLFGVTALALTPFWLAANDFGPFVWLKCYTVFFCVCWGAANRYTTLGEWVWARRAIPGLLAVNILEATALDLFAGGMAHTLNGLAGLLLAATVPLGRSATRIDTVDGLRDVHCGTTRGWVIGYTVWNWAFVNLNYPAFAGHHTAVLAASAIVGLIDPRLWVQSRGATLGGHLFVMLTLNTRMTDWLDTSHWIDERAAVAVAVAALVVVTVGIAFAACSNTFPAINGRNPASVSLRPGNTT